MKKKKLYYVKREVVASNVKQAMTARGVIYCIEESKDEPSTPPIGPVGFSKKKKK